MHWNIYTIIPIENQKVKFSTWFIEIKTISSMYPNNLDVFRCYSYAHEKNSICCNG